MDIMLAFLLLVNINSAVSQPSPVFNYLVFVDGWMQLQKENATFVYVIILTAVQQWKSEKVNMAKAVFWLL